jgi:WD40 repeat protein
MGESDKSYLVHRLRIGDWAASSINSIATNRYSSKIAVGRDDGDIEILDSNSKFYSQARIPGMKNFKLQALAWSTTEENRLFGISLRGFLYEVDLGALRIKNKRDSYGGAAWCLATSPRSPVLAVGCEDGAVRLFRYSDHVESDTTSGINSNDHGSSDSISSGCRSVEPLSSFLEYSKTLPTSGARVLSIAFHPTEPKLFIGCSDSTIRCLEECSL